MSPPPPAGGDGARREDHDLLIRIDTKLDTALDRQQDHEGRLRTLERRLWWAAGFAAAGGSGLTALLTPH